MHFHDRIMTEEHFKIDMLYGRGRLTKKQVYKEIEKLLGNNEWCKKALSLGFKERKYIKIVELLQDIIRFRKLCDHSCAHKCLTTVSQGLTLVADAIGMEIPQTDLDDLFNAHPELVAKSN